MGDVSRLRLLEDAYFKNEKTLKDDRLMRQGGKERERDPREWDEKKGEWKRQRVKENQEREREKHSIRLVVVTCDENLGGECNNTICIMYRSSRLNVAKLDFCKAYYSNDRGGASFEFAGEK